jgi:hypothetical protein
LTHYEAGERAVFYREAMDELREQKKSGMGMTMSLRKE